jgi:hypothetical protein
VALSYKASKQSPKSCSGCHDHPGGSMGNHNNIATKITAKVKNLVLVIWKCHKKTRPIPKTIPKQIS